MMQEKEIYEKLQECIAHTIGIEKEKVIPDASLIDDLGADSLDLLDLVFRLEQTFHIRITRGEIERRARETLSEEEFEHEGLLTDRAKSSLLKALPEVPSARIVALSRKNDIPRVFTVRTFQRLVREKLEAADGA